DELVSKAFSGREGRAFLVNTCINVLPPSKSEERVLMTGRHTVSDVYCRGCGGRIGWKYEKAEEVGQRYKEGKYIIERERVVKENGWELE
ncbi:hypothetical protein BDY24DRAFT_326920, partial [Mrakia frigida]|uniref:uncharacterized protein n=1 Tax=Mrakia frigida TaxID=29902 RepID=UPI003FCBF02A